MVAPKAVRVVEDDDYYRLVFDNDVKNNVTFETRPDRDPRIITMGLAIQDKPSDERDENGRPKIDVAITEVSYPKHLYDRERIVKTANVLEEAISKNACAPCVILSTTEKTRKSYLLPTWKDLLGIDEFQE